MTMKRLISGLVLALSLTACQNVFGPKPIENETGLEDLVLCRGGSEAAAQFELKATLEEFSKPDNQGGHFRIPTKLTHIFDSPVRFFGFLGVDQVAGPSAFLEADLESLRQSLEQNLGKSFKYSEQHQRHFLPIRDAVSGKIGSYVMLFEKTASKPGQGGPDQLSVVMCAVVPKY